jgi:hypothetical protein
VLVATKPPTSLTALDKIAPFELDVDTEGRIGAVARHRGADARLPHARPRRPMLDLDYVYLRLSTRPGDRHVVEINGQDFGGFRKSDLKFLRLLLARGRAEERQGRRLDRQVAPARRERQGPGAERPARRPRQVRRATGSARRSGRR